MLEPFNTIKEMANNLYDRFKGRATPLKRINTPLFRVEERNIGKSVFPRPERDSQIKP